MCCGRVDTIWQELIKFNNEKITGSIRRSIFESTTRSTSRGENYKSLSKDEINAQLQTGLSELKLKYWGQSIAEDLVKRKEQEREVISKYLAQWIAKEKAERHTSMIQSKVRTAKFRRVQTVENYVFRYSKMTEKVEKII